VRQRSIGVIHSPASGWLTEKPRERSKPIAALMSVSVVIMGLGDVEKAGSAKDTKSRFVLMGEADLSAGKALRCRDGVTFCGVEAVAAKCPFAGVAGAYAQHIAKDGPNGHDGHHPMILRKRGRGGGFGSNHQRRDEELNHAMLSPR